MAERRMKESKGAQSKLTFNNDLLGFGLVYDCAIIGYSVKRMHLGSFFPINPPIGHTAIRG
jgi:hypothetical protein